MTYALFVDDERFPPDSGHDWIIARDIDAVRAIISRKGMPAFVSFDHDLGDHTASGFEIAKALIASDLDGRAGDPPSTDARGITGQLPEDFSYTVHSQNPVGAGNISGLLDPYLAFQRG